MHQYAEDGWDNSELADDIVDTEIESIRYRGEKGLSILQAKHHSLQPDMISGWRPKLPSCPLPLSYPNAYVDSLMSHLSKDDTYSVAYMGPRYVNSVQINQKYSYFWRYRERYSLNLAIVQDAVRKIGTEDEPKINVQKASHTFDSAFESGNLDLAVRVKKNQYDCFIRSDTNTKGHTNWYYFKIENKKDVGNVKINICNMTKCRNLYSKGMKPYVRIGSHGKWSQDYCTDVVFVQRFCRYGFDKKTYQLQFCFNFTEPNQQVYFAYSIPYTFTDLQHFIKQLKLTHPSLVSSRKLCQSLGGIQIPILTITNPEPQSQSSQQNSPINNNNNNAQFIASSKQHPLYSLLPPLPPSSTPQFPKKSILITARIHPGQSNSSHMIQGFIRQLLQNNESANTLRSMFVFYIVPMLNPDGVIAGNFRTSYSGKDLNRQFNRLNKFVFPEITALCQFVQRVRRQSNRGIQFYFDFHGHSAKKNLFCYGPQHPTTKIHFFKCRALAKILEKLNPIFSYRKSIFTISEPKKNTGRAYMLRNMKIPMTFTFEISNGLYENQNKTDVHLNKKILLEAGELILKGMYRYAQLEMKLPKKSIKAKVDTGKVKKRNLNSAGASRHNSILKKKISHQQSCQHPFKNKSMQRQLSQKHQSSLHQLEITNKQFLQIIKQIKQQQQQHKQNNNIINNNQQIEGSSDSESEGEDFSKQQTNNLFTQIMKRNNNQGGYGYVIRQKKKNRNVRLNYMNNNNGNNSNNGNKKKDNEQDDIQNINRGTEVMQNKKFKSARMIELSRPPIASIKNIKRGISVEYDKVVLAQKNFTMLL